MAANTKLGRYDLESPIARSELAELVLARCDGIAGFESHVVVKRLRVSDSALVDAFVSGAQLAAKLHHTNIVQIHDVGAGGGTAYAAMDYVHGEDVRTLLGALHVRQEQLPLELALVLVSAVAAALQHAHERRVVHGALTPTNVLIAYDGNVKVTDFGIATGAIRPVDTQSGSSDGKVSYMSPEQCTGDHVDGRSDLFSLGTLLYELVTGRRLFKGATTFLTMTAIVEGEIPKPSTQRDGLPGALDAIIMKALARDPARRFRSAREIAAAVDELAIARARPNGLGRYMAQLFGGRPEPWLVDNRSIERDVPVDFGGTTGTARIPHARSVSLAAPATSPIGRARTRAAQASTAVSLAATALVPPKTPPPRTVVATRRPRAERTQIVAPLPAVDAVEASLPSHDATVAVRTPKRSWIGAAVILLAAFVAVGALIAIPALTRPSLAANEPTRVEPMADTLETKPWDQLTARDLEARRTAAAAPALVAASQPDVAPSAAVDAHPSNANVVVGATSTVPAPATVVEPSATVAPAAVVDPPSTVATPAPVVGTPSVVAAQAAIVDAHPSNTNVAPAAAVDPASNGTVTAPVAASHTVAAPAHRAIATKRVAARPHAKPKAVAPKWDPDSLMPRK